MSLMKTKTFLAVTALSCAHFATAADESQQPLATPAPAQVTTATSEVKASDFFKAERWNIKYSNYMNGPTFSESEGGSIEHYLTVKHKVSESVGVGGVFRPDTNISNGKSAFTLADSYLALWHPIYNAEPGLKITGQTQYYIPMSDSSKEAKLAGIISPRVYINYSIGDVEITNIVIPNIFLNTVSAAGQKQFSIGNYLSASVKMNKYLSLDLGVYPKWTFANGAKAKFNDLAMYPGFTIDFSPKVSLSPYLEFLALDLSSNKTSLGAILSVTLL